MAFMIFDDGSSETLELGDNVLKRLSGNPIAVRSKTLDWHLEELMKNRIGSRART